MHPYRIVFPLLLIGTSFLASPALAEGTCTKSRIERAAPGGEKFPALQVQCDEAVADSPLSATVQEVCGSADLPSSHLEACDEAVARGQAALRKARLRAALRRGLSDEAIADRYQASSLELEALRDSAVRTAPLETQELEPTAP